MQTECRSYHAQEIVYARTVVMQNSDNYAKSTASTLIEKDMQIIEVEKILEKHWSSMSVLEMLQNFEFLSFFAKKNTENISDPKYQGIIEVMTSKVPEFCDKDLQFLLKCLEFWQLDVKNEAFKQLYSAIDKECLNRRKNWSFDEILLINDLFFNIRLNRIVDFTWVTLNKLGRKPCLLSPSQLVQFAFCLKTNRYIHSPLYNTEHAFEQNFDNFTLDELGIFAMAFVKYKSSIKSKDFATRILQKITNEIDSTNDITLVALLKTLTVLKKPDDFENIYKFIEALETQIDKRSIKVLVHVMLWLKELRFENTELMSKMLNRFEKDLPNMNLADIQKVLYTLFTFNYDPKETPFFSSAMNEVSKPDRTQEIERFSKSLISIVQSAVNLNYYPEKALKQIMDPEYTKRHFIHEYRLISEYLKIDYCIEIEHPQYDGPRIQKDQINLLLKRHGSLCRWEVRQNRKVITRFYVVENFLSACKKLFGFESAVHDDILLPHLALPHFVLCYDPETEKYVSPGEQLSKIPTSEIKYAPKDGKEWYVIIITPGLVYIRNTLKPTGFLAMRLRQLKRIGYEPIVIPMAEWSRMKEEAERCEYIKKLLPRQP
ncbi:uncharacterized protein LOC106647449 [Copidosoma floridanum]|uniref:uncharacterized protein LOC106647449 n=1 Tax=Copidosoma floridanum TaxID=29053 RepID=UPI0006C95319|nr:uncharacterized protein LOC106647449 [Copidosoma floridanum]